MPDCRLFCRIIDLFNNAVQNAAPVLIEAQGPRLRQFNYGILAEQHLGVNSMIN
jgi:hypothetical protein